MVLTAAEVADLLTREGNRAQQDEPLDSAEAIQRRVQLLAPVLDTCQQAWQSGSLDIDLLAEKLGDGSRDVAWRRPYGESGILDLFINAVAMDGLRPGLHLHALRIVGNSCADTDENRARVIQGGHLAGLLHRLQDENLIPFTIPVLYNIMVDYEPAQKAASEALLNQSLVTLLQSPNLPSYGPFVAYFCKILALLASQDSEPAVAHPNTIPVLLGLAMQPPFSSELEDFISLASTGAAYLAGAQFQEAMASGGSIGLLLDVFRHAHTAFDVDTIEDSDTADSLKQLRVALLTTLSDVSGNDSFLVHHPLSSPVPQTLLLWLQGPNNALRSAACLILGNLARSDESSVALVHTYNAHQPLIALLSSPEITDSQILHSALSFLKNLAIPAQNKELLGDLANSSCVPRILSLDTLPQVHFSAISLVRLLLVNCPSNVKRICSRRSDDVSSPSHDKSSVHSIVGLFERTDAEPTKLEAARSITVICRVLHSNPVQPILPEWNPENPENLEDESKRREHFYSLHPISKLLGFLVSQDKWPILRSEAWFVFALLSRSKDGAGLILSVQFYDNVTGMMHKTITGRDYQTGDVLAESSPALIESAPTEVADGAMLPSSGVQLEPQQVDPKQKDQMARIDRENCVVMCTELLRSLGDEMPQMRKSLFEDLVKEGTEILAREKAQG